MDDELLFGKYVLCDHLSVSTGSQKLCQGGEQVEKQLNDVFHGARGKYFFAKATIVNRLISLTIQEFAMDTYFAPTSINCIGGTRGVYQFWSVYMSIYLEEVKGLQAEVDALNPEQLEKRTRYVPRPEFVYTRKNPTRRNLPNWLKGQGKFLQDHYRVAIASEALEYDLDTDGFAYEKLECVYRTALNTIYLAEDAWNHRQQNRPGTEIELALSELVHTRVDNYMREYLRHFRYRKPKGELVKAVLTSYPKLQSAIVDGKISNLVIAEFIYGRCDINVSENTISIALRELELIDN